MKYILIVRYANGNKIYYSNDYTKLQEHADTLANFEGYEIHEIKRTMRIIEVID